VGTSGSSVERAGPGLVLDHHLLLQKLLEPRRDQARYSALRASAGTCRCPLGKEPTMNPFPPAPALLPMTRIRCEVGALVEVRSEGLRHGPDEVMARLARGEAVPREAYFFRTLMRFITGAPSWLHLNKVMAIAAGQREARAVLPDVYRIA
jgi:hypothetical protein